MRDDLLHGIEGLLARRHGPAAEDAARDRERARVTGRDDDPRCQTLRGG